MVVRNFCGLVDIFSRRREKCYLKGLHLKSSPRAALVLGTPLHYMSLDLCLFLSCLCVRLVFQSNFQLLSPCPCPSLSFFLYSCVCLHHCCPFLSKMSLHIP